MSKTVEEVLKQRGEQEDVNAISPSVVVKGPLYGSDWDIATSILLLKTSAFSCLLMMERLFVRRSLS